MRPRRIRRGDEPTQHLACPHQGFQSAPGCVAGRFKAAIGDAVKALIVSIRARLWSRAIVRVYAASVTHPLVSIRARL